MPENEINISKTEQGVYKIEIKGEDHTMGNLLANILQTLDGVNIAYYEVPHPLEDRIFLYMDLNEGINPIEKIKEALNKIKEINSDFKNRYLFKSKEKGLEVEE
ncbi:MAG: RpoL/Rpb11 RNA polymerase subunit family protein [Caldisphaera sp.]|jgi:DNA-directed RNA polymerase subunit L|nr:RpoL/Rpb11 RNA polymerase subunit family protein [Caldisphaera sp.]PMP61166.1 MAG: DNA-directed RNA polymerase subunit L [Caldisphaera sp.]PMP90837.1 MAG: DNA-directed RNA polymerase subunit L [Caldisphaera sp.]